MDLNPLNPLQSTWIEMKPNKPLAGQSRRRLHMHTIAWLREPNPLIMLGDIFVWWAAYYICLSKVILALGMNASSLSAQLRRRGKHGKGSCWSPGNRMPFEQQRRTQPGSQDSGECSVPLILASFSPSCTLLVRFNKSTTYVSYSLCSKIIVVLTLNFYVYIQIYDDESRHM